MICPPLDSMIHTGHTPHPVISQGPSAQSSRTEEPPIDVPLSRLDLDVLRDHLAVPTRVAHGDRITFSKLGRRARHSIRVDLRGSIERERPLLVLLALLVSYDDEPLLGSRLHGARDTARAHLRRRVFACHARVRFGRRLLSS